MHVCTYARVYSCLSACTLSWQKKTRQPSGKQTRLANADGFAGRGTQRNRSGRLRVKNPGSLFATRLATRRCESSETSGGRGRFSFNPQDATTRPTYTISYLLVSPHSRLLPFYNMYVRAYACTRPPCPSYIFGAATRRIASRCCIRNRRRVRGQSLRSVRRVATHRSINRCFVSVAQATCRNVFLQDNADLTFLSANLPPLSISDHSASSRLFDRLIKTFSCSDGPRRRLLFSAFFFLLLFPILYSPLRAWQADVCENTRARANSCITFGTQHAVETGSSAEHGPVRCVQISRK